MSKVRNKIACFPALVDICERDGRSVFLIIKSGRSELVTHCVIDGETCYPPDKSQIPWLLPRVDQVLRRIENPEPPASLFLDLVRYHKAISYLPEKDYYVLLAAWVFHTYLLEWWEYSPYLCLYAQPEFGKTRTGKGIIHAARRGIHSEAIRPANLIREAGDLDATVFLDVKDPCAVAQSKGCEDLLLHRYERGAETARVLYPDRGVCDDTKRYVTYGPTIIASNRPLREPLESRCIMVPIQKSLQSFPLTPKPGVGLPFRERLTAWRACMLIEEPRLSDKPAPGRLGDLIQPLATVIDMVEPRARHALDRIVDELGASRRQILADTLEGKVLKAMLSHEHQVSDGYLAESTFAGDVRIGAAAVGRVLRGLGIRTKKRTGGMMYVVWNEKQILTLAENYGVIDEDEQDA